MSSKVNMYSIETKCFKRQAKGVEKQKQKWGTPWMST